MNESEAIRIWESAVGDSGEPPTDEELTAFANAIIASATPSVETLAATLALAYGSQVSPPRGGRDWKAAEAVLALLGGHQ